MPAYDYKGIIGEKNTYTDGIIEAINEDEAAFRLREQKIIIISLSKSKKKSASDKTKKKKDNDGDSLLSKIPFQIKICIQPLPYVPHAEQLLVVVLLFQNDSNHDRDFFAVC